MPKPSFIREEKNRGEKKNNNNKEKEIIAVAAVDKLSPFPKCENFERDGGVRTANT